MEKELHIWMGENFSSQINKEDLSLTIEATKLALDNGKNRVDTVQPHFCNSSLFEKGYKIFVHMLDGKTVEIKLGVMKETWKEIRLAHNLEKLLLTNEFGHAMD